MKSSPASKRKITPVFRMITLHLPAIWIITLGIIKKRRVIAFLLIFILLILLFPCPRAEAQSISYGLSAGIPVNNLATTDGSRVASTMRFTLGPSLRFTLPKGFGIDLDLLYKRLDVGVASDTARITAHRLELVPLLRYVYSPVPIHPFVHAGVSFNWVLNTDRPDACTDRLAGNDRYYCVDGKTAAELRHAHTHGFVLGTGADFQLKAFHLVPELRVTRWVDRNFGTQDASFRSNLTQVEMLFAILF